MRRHQSCDRYLRDCQKPLDTIQQSPYRDLLAKYLKQKDIGVNFHYPAVYSYPYYQKLGFGKNNLKNSKIYHQTTLTLPLPPQLMKSQVKYISNQIKFFFGYEV